MTDRLVPTAYGTIMLAMAAADPGDNIVLEEIGSPFTGAGNKNIDPGGTDYVFKGEIPEPVKYVIDCEGSGRGFYLHTSESAATVLDAFSIINGGVGYPGGGGVRCHPAAPIIQNLIIKNCDATPWWGGAIFWHTCYPQIKNCLLQDNIADRGGGAACRFSDAPEGAKIINCTVVGNTATISGGGLQIEKSRPLITNSIVWGNIEPSTPNVQIYITGFLPVISYCDVQDKDIGGIAGPWTDGGGNIDLDPLFDVDGYHIQVGSPCINAGDPTVVDWDWDIDGQDRKTAGGDVDMGADQWESSFSRRGRFGVHSCWATGIGIAG